MKKQGNNELFVRLTDLYQPFGKGIKLTQCHSKNQHGMIIGLIGQGLSESEIRSFIPCGGHKTARIRGQMKNPSKREKRLSEKNGPHTCTDDFPCSHQRIKKYCKDEGVEWKLSNIRKFALHIQRKTNAMPVWH